MGAQTPPEVSTELRRIAEKASVDPNRRLMTLSHHITIELLHEAYRQTRKSGAVGVDGQTAEDYARNLDANLEDLLNRFKSGTYYAPPVRRTYIAKNDGGKRPLGIPTFEDKVLQRAVKMVLEPIYEQDFMDFSYGFRPGRDQHSALDALREGLVSMRGGWVIDADIKAYFDQIDHAELRNTIDLRVGDGVIRRTLHKWLNAGIMEDEELRRPTEGTPQGGVISPLLANVFLHEVVDKWFENDVKPVMRGRAFMIRFADDFLMVFELESDARRVLKVLAKRLDKYKLTLHPEKTRLVRFRRPLSNSTGKGSDGEGQRPETFDFLSFTHLWARSRRGYWVIKVRMSSKALRRVMIAHWQWCRRHRSLPIPDQHRILSAKLQGQFNYYARIGALSVLWQLRRLVERAWKYWLSRRSQKAYINWTTFKRFLNHRPLPKPKLPERRLAKL